MLGNDVVDLEDVDARPETFRSRFDLRVFAEEERRAIAADPHPQARRWAHWGAKEAAYKLARQIDSRFAFSPARLVPCFGPRVARIREAQGQGTPQGPGTPRCALGPTVDPESVECRRGRLELALDPRADALALELCSFETSRFVHVVAQPAGGDWARVVLAVAALDAQSADPGRAVRRLAVQEIARAIGVDAARLAVVRRANEDDDRVPMVALDGRALGGSLSLSHHGRFVAFAFRDAPAADDRLQRAEAEAGRPPAALPDAGPRAGRSDRTEQALFTERPAWVHGFHRPVGFVGDPIRRMNTAWMAG